jgi:uncharacterized cysteine cluster protein YcgN (CxxCxxCC family)
MGALKPAGSREPDRFWERQLDSLNRTEWEALCDGCGKCCLHKLEDEDTGDFYETNVACKLLDLTTARCGDYRNRRAFVPDCIRLTPARAAQLPWLPATCAYRLRAEGKPLPEWHYLICGDREAVHKAGASVVGKAISEQFAGPLEQHIVWPHDSDDADDGDGDA